MRGRIAVSAIKALAIYHQPDEQFWIEPQIQMGRNCNWVRST